MRKQNFNEKSRDYNINTSILPSTTPHKNSEGSGLWGSSEEKKLDILIHIKIYTTNISLDHSWKFNWTEHGDPGDFKMPLQSRKDLKTHAKHSYKWTKFYTA